MENWKMHHALIVFVCFHFRFQRTIRLPEHNKDNHNNKNITGKKGEGSERCQIEPMSGQWTWSMERRKMTWGKGSFDIFQAQEANAVSKDE